MSLVQANGVDVIGGTIVMPLSGAWTADIVIDQPDGTGFDAGTAITIAANGFELHGTVCPGRTGDFLDAVHVRVIGGAGGMAKAASARGYVQPSAFVRDVVNALIDDSGETLSSTTDAGFLSTNLIAWATLVGPVSRAIELLIEINAPAMGWRILPDGTLWVGTESWPTFTGTFELLELNPSESTALFGVDAPALAPGFSIDGIGNIARVEHQILPSKIRSRIWTDIASEDRGIASAVQDMVDHRLAPIDYFALYRYKVVSQSADLSTVDVTPVPPNDQRLPGLSAVPVRAGTDINVQFNQGNSVLVGWDGGDPSSPFVCCGLSEEEFRRIQIGGNIDVARKDDTLTTSAALTTWAQAVEGYINGQAPGTIDTLWAAGAGLAQGLGKIAVGSDKVGAG